MIREPIGYVEALVTFPLYEGDKTDSQFPWFVYEEPGITPQGELGVCRRECKTISVSVKEYDK